MDNKTKTGDRAPRQQRPELAKVVIIAEITPQQEAAILRILRPRGEKPKQ